MTRVIRQSGSGLECVEDGRVLFRQGRIGVIAEVDGERRIRGNAGFWNCFHYEFSSGEAYPLYPPEPRLTWHARFLRPERMESDGYAGHLIREHVLDQIMVRLGDFEWRYDITQRELYFPVPEKAVELRATALAFQFFNGCRGD